MKKHKLYILRTLGLILFSLYVYLRFIHERLPRDLVIINSLYNNIDYYKLIFVLFMLSISLIGTITYYKAIYNKQINIPNLYIIQYITKIVLYIKEAILSIVGLIASLIPNSYEKLKYLVLFFYNRFGHYEIALITIFLVIPYTIITIAFTYDIFICFKLQHFYSVLPILAMPLVYNIWIYHIEDIASNLNNIEDYLIIKHKFLEDGQDHFSFKPNPVIDKEEMKLNFQEYVQEYLLLYPLRGFIQTLEYLEYIYKYKILFIMYSIYSLGWIYVLIKNIYWIF